MKRAYQIDEQKAIDRFRSYTNTNPGNIQLVLPLADLAQRLRHGVSQMLFDAERELLMLIMNDEIRWLSQQNGMARWGTAPGSVIIHGQKVPVDRPRLRNQAKEGKLGSSELFRLEDEMQQRVWDKVMRGVSMRSYDSVVRESQPSFGIGKSAISDRFIVASGHSSAELKSRCETRATKRDVLWQNASSSSSRLPGRAHFYRRPAVSKTSRTFRARASGVNGFRMYATSRSCPPSTLSE